MKSLDKKINLTNVPLIKPGGASDSSVLNEYFKVMSSDTILVLDNLHILKDNFNSLNYSINSLADGLNTVLSAINTKLDNVIASGSSRVLLDVASSTYIDTNESNCQLERKYCQATLPVSTEQDLLVYTDALGNSYTPDSVIVEVNHNGEWYIHPDGKEMIIGNQPMAIQWDNDTMDSSDTFSIRVNFPFKYQGLNATVAEFTLLPLFASDITSITYRSSTSTTEVPLDISYLPGYNSIVYSNNYVNSAGPVRVFLPNTEIVALTINFKVPNSTNWGLLNFKLKHLSFDATGEIVLTSPLGSFTTVEILGKDPDDLADLSYTIDGDTVTITLGSLDPFSTQVVTGILVE